VGDGVRVGVGPSKSALTSSEDDGEDTGGGDDGVVGWVVDERVFA
jgi:hypothetical protein